MQSIYNAKMFKFFFFKLVEDQSMKPLNRTSKIKKGVSPHILMCSCYYFSTVKLIPNT